MTWLLGEHESWMTRWNLGMKNLETGEFWTCNLAISDRPCFCWRIQISNVWMLVRNLLLATWCLGNFESNLVSPVNASPTFPGTLWEIRVHERHTWIHPEGRGWNEMKWNHVMLCYHVMSARVVYGLATWPCPKLEIRRCVYSSHHWPLRWPSTNDERDGPLLIPFDSGISTHTHTRKHTHRHTHTVGCERDAKEHHQFLNKGPETDHRTWGMKYEIWKMDSDSQLSRMLYRSYLVSGSQLSRLSDAGTLGWSDPVSHDCGSFVECGPTIMPHSPAKSIFRLHVISSVHTHMASQYERQISKKRSKTLFIDTTASKIVRVGPSKDYEENDGLNIYSHQ